MSRIEKRKTAQAEIRRIAGDKRLVVTGERGDWYIDNSEASTLDRRTRGHESLQALVDHVRVCVSLNHPIIHIKG